MEGRRTAGYSGDVSRLGFFLVCSSHIQEVTLPHSPRTVVFLNSETLCLGYTPTDYVLFSLRTRTAIDIATPVPVTSSTSSMAIGALSGWGGYMTLGLGAKQKPCVLKVTDTEVLIAKDSELNSPALSFLY